MAYNGSGVFNIDSSGQPVVSSTLIDAATFNAFTADIASGLTTVITKDGQTVVTADIPFANNKLTGVKAGTARTDAASLATIQDGTGVYVAAVAGTADVITLTPTPAITAYVAGQAFYWIASGANTTNVTVNTNGLGDKAVTKNGTTALIAGDLPAGALVGARYDGTQFQVIGMVSQNVITTEGDVIVGSSSGAEERLALGAEGQSLVSNGTTVVWANNFEIGDTVESLRTSKTGWHLLFGQTIGSASSGADSAIAGNESLFTILWTSLADAQSPMLDSGGSASSRGASAAADWSANKRMTLPDARGRTSRGKDNMGGVSADVNTNAQGDLLGGIEGAETHTLTEAELASHAHDLNIQLNVNSGGGISVAKSTGTGFSTNPAGGDAAHNNMSPYLTMNTFIKYI